MLNSEWSEHAEAIAINLLLPRDISRPLMIYCSEALQGECIKAFLAAMQLVSAVLWREDKPYMCWYAALYSLH